MIESFDRIVNTAEANAGRALLAAFSAHRKTLRHYAEGSIAVRRSALKLAGCEQAYDSLAVTDRQVRDAMDDAMLNAGWERAR